MIEWVKIFISVSLGLQYQKIPAFRQLTKSVEVYLTAETGQFRQLIWFARMTLAAENISMCKNQILLHTHQIIKRAYCNRRKERLMVHML